MQHLRGGGTWGFRRLSAGVPPGPWGSGRSEEGRAGCWGSRSAWVPSFLGNGPGSPAGWWGHGRGSHHFPARPTLALLQMEADELLDAPAVLELRGATARQGARLARGRLGLAHLLRHARETEPGVSAK